MAKHRRPRRGSMAYYPRKRARSIVARIRRWGEGEKPQLLGFAGYKVGVLHVVKIEDNPHSPLHGQEVVKVATVIETPPLRTVAIRVYSKTPYGLKSLSEIWAKQIPKELERVFTTPKKAIFDKQSKEIDKLINEINEVRILAATQPRNSGLGKKKPELLEIKVGGKPRDALTYALSILGKEVAVSEVLSAGQYVDVFSITKGKGFQGVIKRFGVKEMPRWHKHRKGSRRIGTVGPKRPAIMFTTPFSGQLGFHQRTEYNKRVLKVEDKPSPDINPQGGWPHYGIVKSSYILLEGTVPGPAKRLIKIRFAIRPPKVVREEPRVLYVSTSPMKEGEG